MSTATLSKKDAFLESLIPNTELSENTAVKESLETINNLEFPTTRDEYWKYTRVGKIVNTTYSQTPSFKVESINDFIIPDLDCYRIVFINGYYSAEHSTLQKTKGFMVSPMAAVRRIKHQQLENNYGKLTDHKSHIFSAINTVYNTNGVFIHVKDNVVVDKPIHVLNITDASNAAFNPRNLFVIGKSAQVELIHSYETLNGAAFTNAVTEIFVNENANVDSYIVQNQGDESKQVNTIDVQQKSNSNYSATTLTVNGGLVRNNHNVKVVGKNCETNLYGLYFTKRKQHVDNHTMIDHIEPNCNSNELYKGVMNDNSTGVFNGKVFVRPEAQITNAFQQNQNILLTDDASVYSKPELEIYADDVKCSHGSTTGQFDDEALFYLRARGIKEDTARKIMIKAFVHEVLENIKIEPLKAAMINRVEGFYDN